MSIKRHVRFRLLLMLTLVMASTQAHAQEHEYEVGGPLAGVLMPKYVTQHGEPAGHPGLIPGEQKPSGQFPQLELYPGSVEHWRAYFMKYTPQRSFFDRQSQIRNFIAPDVAGATQANVREYAEPVYYVPRHAPPVDTGRKNKPVPVIVMNGRGPRLQLDLGELDRGLYVVRVIGAVESGQLSKLRRRLVLSMQVNDLSGGATSAYRLHAGYTDEFYSVAEFYFHAMERRNYHAELWADEANAVDLFVHNVSLDDVLAGTRRAAIKTQVVLSPRRQRGPVDKPPNRLQRDAVIWELFPPLNAQGTASEFSQAAPYSIFHSSLAFGADGKSLKEINEGEHGAWESGHQVNLGKKMSLAFPPDHDPDLFLVNRKLGLRYTMQDLRNNRPLPDPYPYKDDGTGLTYARTAPDGKDQLWSPIGMEVMQRIRQYPTIFHEGARVWRERGDAEAAHDGAIALVRYALQFPAISSSDWLGHVVRDPSAYGRELRNRRRETEAMFLDHYGGYPQLIADYDRLFDYIQGNEELAKSVGQFVPWVKSPQDVVELLDVYLVQTMAKRVMRHHYHTHPVAIANIATALNSAGGENQKITDPWMDWLFSGTFVRPLPPAGIQDTMITGTDRDGAGYVGSIFYAQGEGASEVGEGIARYLATGGNRKYDLTDPSRYPKPLAHAYWHLEHQVAGQDFLRIGDVAGPDKPPGDHLTSADFRTAVRNGWNWSKDPRFAFMLKHFFAREGETDAQWQEIERATGDVKRAPWLDLRSRVLPMWAGILETGHRHDDHRFRRSAYLRVGYGYGHEHHDMFDLQVVAHGTPFTADNGQRPGYTTPNDRSTLIHNTATVDNTSRNTYSWVRALSDREGARYLTAEAEPFENVNLFSRQVALIDVDEGRGSQPLPIEQQGPKAKLPGDVVTGNSYVFDVFRIDGGSTHTYSFHGTPDDAFEWNVADAKQVNMAAVAAETEGQPLHPRRPLLEFKRSQEQLFAGTSPEVLRATWQMARSNGERNFEKSLLGPNYDPEAPRRYTRLHLLDAANSVAMHASVVCYKWNYQYTNLMVSRHDTGGLSGVYPAVIEPFVGESFVTGTELLRVVNNENDARKAVAVRVTTSGGHTDLLFADGRPDQTRELPDAGLRVSGEFALYSTDESGLRIATLTGGTFLAGAELRLEPARREHTGKITAVDYYKKSVTIDSTWPAPAGAFQFEVGQPDVRQMTSYRATGTNPVESGVQLQLDRGADFYRSKVVEVDEGAGEVTTTLTPIVAQYPGRRTAWVASNDDMTQFWRAEYLGNERFRITGAPISRGAFGQAGVLRLWEYGVDDQVRQSTSASVRRTESGVYAVTGNVDLKVSFRAIAVERSTDSRNWRSAEAQAEGGWQSLTIPASHLAKGPIYFRIVAR